MGGQSRESLRGERQVSAAVLARVTRQEVAREQLRVARPVPQRRKRDDGDVEPVEEVLPEPARLHLLLQVARARRDDAHVELPRPVLADAADLAFLQGAQELGLERRRQVPDLVEEDRAALRLFEQAFPVPVRSGERAAGMPEELALRRAGGIAGTLTATKGPGGARRARARRARSPPCRSPTRQARAP